MATIKDFDTIYVGNDHPAHVRIEQAPDKSLMISFHKFFDDGVFVNTCAEFRKKGNEFALFLFQYSDSELPSWWQDSKLIWSIGEREQDVE